MIMRYEKGDIVKVRSLEWFKKNCHFQFGAYYKKGEENSLAENMINLCGELVTIKKVDSGSYKIEEMGYNWYDWMLEDYEWMPEMEEVLIPFDIEKAKAGAEVVTGDGCPVRILCYDRIDPNYNIVALICSEGVEKLHTFTEKGELEVGMPYYQNLQIVEYQPKQKTELTMQEIADKFGIDVKQLKIKK